MFLSMTTTSSSSLNPLHEDAEWFIEEVECRLSTIDENGTEVPDIGRVRFSIVDLYEAEEAGLAVEDVFDQSHDLDWIFSQITNCPGLDRNGRSEAEMEEVVRIHGVPLSAEPDVILSPDSGSVMLLHEIVFEKAFRGGCVLDVLFEMLARQYGHRCRYVVGTIVPIDFDEDGLIKRCDLSVDELRVAEGRLRGRYVELGFEKIGASENCMGMRFSDYALKTETLQKLGNPFVSASFETAIVRHRDE